MTKEQMWKRFDEMSGHGNCIILCALCDQPIIPGIHDAEYIKTKRKSEFFVHRNCVEKLCNRAENNMPV